MKSLHACLCLMVWAFWPAPLLAWEPIGHMTVAYIAYQNLTPAAKTRVRELLKLNPDYANWEKQIPAGTSADDHDRMIFMMASTWADDIKTEGQYSDDGTDGGNAAGGDSSSQNIGYLDMLRHKYWHFVNTPFSPDQATLPALPVPNAQTQIVAFRAVLASSQPDELKSYDLVWLVHLIGDVHQPLHAAVRITQSQPKGDAGGNRIKLFGDAASTLHIYWDELPGSDCKFCADRIQCLNRAIVLGKAYQSAARKSGSMDTAVWIRESFDGARTKVYRDPIGSTDQPYSIVPGSSYETQAQKIAKVRIALAGIRLARVLNAELK